jgi:rod shape-determining protein MreD
MTGPRVALTAGFMLLAQLLDVGVLDRLPVAGTAADLLVLVVVAAALAGGSVTGATVGICAGLLADLTPPAAGLLGVNALAYGLAGGVAGRWHRPGGRATDRSMALALALVAAAAAAVLMTAVHLAFGLGRHSVEQAAVTSAVAAAAAVGLGVVVLPALSALDRRVAQELP